LGDDCEVQATKTIWVNGELVDWADARFHVSAHSLHYGTGVFEGIRCYATGDGPAVFRLSDHLQRLTDSARLVSMRLPYTVEELRAAVLELIAANDLPACYVRPLAFYGAGELTVYPGTNPVEVVIMAWPWGAYLGEAGQREGISAIVSSWKRVGPNTIPHVAKASGVYLNSMLATQAAKRAACEEAILLTDEGVVADGPGENVFVVKEGVIRTPPLSTSILPGITRNTVLTLARDRGYAVEERHLIRTDLYLADEVFMTGTAAEVTPVRAVDGHEIGAGPVTLELQQAYWDAVHGRSERYLHWLDFVEARRDGDGRGA
jgi:branched-chain amino acid aminotransferase